MFLVGGHCQPIRAQAQRKSEHNTRSCLLIFYILTITKVSARGLGLVGGITRAVIIARLSATASICESGEVVATGGGVEAVNITGAVRAVRVAKRGISV